jgi:hypothetical protein
MAQVQRNAAGKARIRLLGVSLFEAAGGMMQCSLPDQVAVDKMHPSSAAALSTGVTIPQFALSTRQKRASSRP